MEEPTPGNSVRLDGQVALVTGGGRGIGRAIAQSLAAAGASVAVLARSSDELDETVRIIEAAHGRALPFAADVTNTDAIQSVIKAVEESLGPMDLLVNNAATIGPLAPFWESDINAWWKGMEVNVLGALLCARFALPGMVARRRGRIINIASGAGATAMTYFSSYVCSKTTLVRFTECLALECEPYGISIFAISPGTVKTAMSEFSLNSDEGKKYLHWFKRIFDEKFVVPPERPARLVLELASGRADRLSGRFLSIYDDLDHLSNRSNEIGQQNLYALKIEKFPAGAANPLLASIMAASRQTVK